MTLKQLSDTILERESYSDWNYICTFYSSSGEPLISWIKGYEYFNCSDVIDSGDIIFILITQNRYKNIWIDRPNYERKNIINMKSSDSKKTTEIFVNFNEDTWLDAKKYETELNLKIIACFRHFSENFTPLINSVNLVLNNCKLCETEKIALDEGMFMVFNNILGKLNIEWNKNLVFVKTLEIFGFILEICKLESFDLDIFEQIQKISIHCGFNNEKIISDPIIVKKMMGLLNFLKQNQYQKWKNQDM